MEITGRLHRLFDTVTIVNFTKRDFILETEYETEYPQLIKMELHKDRVNLLDSIEMNTELTISFNVKGRKWTDPNGKDVYFTTLVAWKYSVKQPKPPVIPEIPKQEDDLPF